jgi:NAD+ diphosphatase
MSSMSTHHRYFIVHPKGIVLRKEGAELIVPNDADAAVLGLDRKNAHVVGRIGDDEALAISLADFPTDRLAGQGDFQVVGPRALFAFFDEATIALTGRAMHVIDWATTSQFCGRCGTATILAEKERCMTCPKCALTQYPRISPAIIVLVRKGDQALLARNAKFPGAFYSTLAGFSEIGESLEETLVREVREEVGVGVKDIRYFGSQPWPFPHSLMLGFTADWADGDIVVDGEEIADAKWFDAHDLPEIPPPISIARKLIDAWVAEITGRS